MEAHRWEDTSYHGSPIWECDFCGCSKSDVLHGKVSAHCPKASEKLQAEYEAVQIAERNEYERMKRERERWVYLHGKFGGGK